MISTPDPAATSSIIEVGSVDSTATVVFDSPEDSPIDHELLAETLEYIRPALQADGGDVWIHSRGGSKMVMIKKSGRIGIGVRSPSHPLQLAGGAHCRNGRDWRGGSSITYKKDVEALSLRDALEALDGLRPVTFKYIDDEDELRAGFISEEVPELVATSDRKSLSPMDIVAVLTRVMKFQQHQMRDVSKLLGNVSRRLGMETGERTAEDS